MPALTVSGKTVSSENSDATLLRNLDSWLSGQPEGELHDALLKISATLHSGESIVVASEQEELTPAQVAGLLGVSRTHLYKILDAGVLPYRLVGARDRRIAMKDVKEYVERTENLRRQAAWQAAHLDDLEDAAIDEM